MKHYFSICLLLVAIVCSGGQRGLPAQEGIANFGKVNDSLYRGAQPDAAGIENLKRLGIKTIICLRSGGSDKAWQNEKAEAQARGILCTNIPLSGVRRPKDAQVKIALAAIKNLPAPVFVHCQYGCDRTGTIIACYRIQFDKWSNQAALEEAERYGISKLERGMKDYILHFGQPKRSAHP